MIWSELFNEIMPHVPGCPEPMVEDAVKQVAINFCRETHAWEEEVNQIYPVAGITKYELTIPDETKVISLSYAEHITGPESTSKLTEWPSVNVFGLLSFHKSPNADLGPIKIKVILRPSEDATGIIDSVGFDYREALISGTIAKLQMMPRRDWTNIPLSGEHMLDYRTGVIEARNRRNKGNTDGNLRVRPRAFM